MPTADTTACVEQIGEVGYCILRDHFPVEVVQNQLSAFAPICGGYLKKHRDNPNRGPNRHYIPLAIRPPFYHPAIFNNDAIFEIASSILGEKMAIDQFASDTPFNGSVHQDVHADLGLLFDEEPDLSHPPALLAINWPFVDVTPERGPFQIAESTHRLPREATIAKINTVEIPLKPLIMNVGDVLIRDPRCLHRGSPNTTDTPRVVAVVSYMRQWYSRERDDAHPIPRSVWDELSDREQLLLRRFVIDETG